MKAEIIKNLAILSALVALGLAIGAFLACPNDITYWAIVGCFMSLGVAVLVKLANVGID